MMLTFLSLGQKEVEPSRQGYPSISDLPDDVGDEKHTKQAVNRSSYQLIYAGIVITCCSSLETT